MIELKKGNLLEADAEALVNTVNTEGVMGKGVALQFKKAFPDMFAAYKAACKAGDVKLGQMHVFERRTLTNPRYIINFPTKKHWKGRSRLVDIQIGLNALVEEVRRRNIRSLALPPLGCGHGGLQWENVFPLIDKALMALPGIQAFVYPPQSPPEAARMLNRTERPHMTPSRASVLTVLAQYCVLGYELTLLEVHKLLYFLQEAGEPLKLEFKKGTYGPYADNLRHVLNLFEGHYTSGFGDGRNKPDTRIQLLPQTAEEAKAFLEKREGGYKESQGRMQRVTDLIEGFESPYGMELLATVHWIVRHDKAARNAEDTVHAVQSWNERKRRMMRPEHIRLAWRTLNEKGWLG